MEILIFVALIAVAVLRNKAMEKQQEQQREQQREQNKQRTTVQEQIDEVKKRFEKDGFDMRFESQEGTKSTEGECVEPNPNHCAVEHFEDTVYTSEIGKEESDFTREDFVKGIIMAEILSKPKSVQ